MRSAPPISVDIGLSPHWRWGIRLLAVGACAVSAAWMLERSGVAGLLPLPGVLLFLCTAALGWWSLDASVSTQGRLRWDGEQWWFVPRGAPDDADRPVIVQVHLDLWHWMLVHARVDDAGLPRRRGTWLALQRSAIGGSWFSLRRALFAARPTAKPALPDAAAARDEVRADER